MKSMTVTLCPMVSLKAVRAATRPSPMASWSRSGMRRMHASKLLQGVAMPRVSTGTGPERSPDTRLGSDAQSG